MADSPTFGHLPADEVERRRLASIDAMYELERADFERWYQQRCDAFFWKNGPCCAGCDHWCSERGDTGQCTSAPIVSGVDVLRSMGIRWSSYVPPPGHPYTDRAHRCGAFSDTFDWGSLDPEYLRLIGARL